MTDINIEDDLIDETEAAAFLKQQPRTLTVWRCQGRGPKYLKIGRRIYYRRQWLRDYMASCEVNVG